MKKIALLSLLLLAFAVPALAQATDVPFFSVNRLAFAGGVNYDWFKESNPPPADEEFSVGIYMAYALTAPAALTGQRAPRISFISSLERGFDNRMLHAKVGLRVTLFDGGN